MTMRTGLVIAAAMWMGSAIGAEAQGVRVIPQVGLYVPASSFGDVTGDGIDGAIELGRHESTRAYGLGLEWGSNNALGLRGNVVYATASEIPISGFGCTTCASRSTMVALTGGLVWRPFRLLFIEPYFVGGLGIKRYDFTNDDLSEGADAFFSDRNERTWQLGVGGELALGPVNLLIELSDYMSRDRPAPGFDAERRHDFIVSLGLGLGG